MSKNAPALREAATADSAAAAPRSEALTEDKPSRKSRKNGKLADEHDSTNDTKADKTKADKKKSRKDKSKRSSEADSNLAKKAESEAGEESPRGKLAFESSMERDEVATYLEAVAAGLRKGSIHFRQNDDALTLSPAARVDFEVKVTGKSSKEKLEIEIVWRTDDPDDLTIVSG
jgi:amphi-Trp domain-containing protein